MHQIVVKVRFISPTISHRPILDQDQHIYEATTAFIEYPAFLLLLTLVHLNPILRANKLLFGPGLLGTLGEYIHLLFESEECKQDFFPAEQHRKQRKMLNPVFSIAHLREMSKLWSLFSRSRRTERS